jgi:hypothetical protein
VSATLLVRVTPRGGADRIDGFVRDASGRELLALRVRAAPADGEANAAVTRLLAAALNVPKTSVAVVRGATARVKTVAIEGLSEADLRARLAGITEE